MFWPHLMACGILVPQQGSEPRLLAAKAWNPNPWASREFPRPETESQSDYSDQLLSLFFFSGTVQVCKLRDWHPGTTLSHRQTWLGGYPSSDICQPSDPGQLCGLRGGVPPASCLRFCDTDLPVTSQDRSCTGDWLRGCSQWKPQRE